MVLHRQLGTLAAISRSLLPSSPLYAALRNMSPPNPTSLKALDRLRAYTPPPTIYTDLALSQRAAVLILLFADRRGDLRVVLTVRSHLLRTFAGHVALPGGRADFLTETPFDTARREAFEEIGLPLESEQFPPPFSVEHLTELPCSLARTALGVRPCVAFLKDGSAALQGTDVEDNLIPRLEENEVASIFTVPLERFMSRRYTPLPGATEADENWYSGSWIKWNGTSWRAHEFQAPVWEKTTLRKYRVWGMTGRIMVDVARIAYGRDPDFAHNEEFGDEHMVRELHARGEMGEEAARKKDKGLAKREEVEVKKGNL